LQDGVTGADTEWAKANEKLFATPDAKEGAFVGRIYSVDHFQANIEKQKLFKGGRNADAFIVARAYAIGGTVVTMERLKQNAVKIPNICEHFKIPYLDLEGFMETEGWEF
jgi:hypothetical protein